VVSSKADERKWPETYRERGDATCTREIGMECRCLVIAFNEGHVCIGGCV